MFPRPAHHPLRRCISSKSAKHPTCSRPPLPPNKMRALISLYHQADSFITLDNLQQRIHLSFLNSDPLARVMSNNLTYADLRRLVDERRTAPRMGAGNDNPTHIPLPVQRETLWSERSTGREMRVFQALYGVDADGKPGLEVLEESKERIEQNILEDQRMAAARGPSEVCFDSLHARRTVDCDTLCRRHEGFAGQNDDFGNDNRGHIRCVILCATNSITLDVRHILQESRPRALGRVSSQPPGNMNCAASSLSSMLNTATVPPFDKTAEGYAAGGYTWQQVSANSALCNANLTCDEVPTTRQRSASATNLSISSTPGVSSPNHTTPGRARDPHFEHRGRAETGMSGSIAPPSSSASVPLSASQMGESKLDSTWRHSHELHWTSNRRPCISIKCGCLRSGGCLSSSEASERTMSSALRLRPSTFWVSNVNVESGAILCRIDGSVNFARAMCAALGWARRPLGNCSHQDLVQKSTIAARSRLTSRAGSGRTAR